MNVVSSSFLLKLPQDIFRVIFQYLSVYDLMKGEEAFLNNQELLSLYRSSLDGFTLKEKITNQFQEGKESISWIIDRKLLVEKLELFYLGDREMSFLNQFRFSLKSIHFTQIYPGSDNSASVIGPLGHFPSLTSVTFYYSHYFTYDKLLSFFSHNPQLEIVRIDYMLQLSNKIIPHLSNYCPKVKILSILENNWVNDGTISLLTEQRLFPNLKSLNIQYTSVRDYESLRQFILSHPLLSGLYLPNQIQYSKDFLLFYLRQVIFPSILSQNNNNDLESHSLAISSLGYCFDEKIFDERNDVVNPEIFSVDLLLLMYHTGSPVNTLHETVQIFSHLSKFPSMIDSIMQSQLIPCILNNMSPHDSLPFNDFVALLFHCGVFHDYFPLFVEKYRIHFSSLIEIFRQAIEDHFPLLASEDIQTMFPIVLNGLQKNNETYSCLDIFSKLLEDPSSQHLIDPNHLLMSLKSIDISNENSGMMIDCLTIVISVNENYQRLLIESNLLPQIMKLVDTKFLINFTKDCLLSSEDGLLVDHLVSSGWFEDLLTDYSEFPIYDKNEMESLFKLLIEFKNNKYSEIVNGMKLPDELRVKLFEKRERV